VDDVDGKMPGLKARKRRNNYLILSRIKRLLFLSNFQTGSGDNPSSTSDRNGSALSGGKEIGA
jgi:hypothetical protein